MPRASTAIVGSEPVAWAENAFKRFPSWMWRNREVDGFVRWLREHNAALTAEQRVEFRGLDVYSSAARCAKCWIIWIAPIRRPPPLPGGAMVA